MIGLSAAMLLARDGHDVTVLERDPAEVPSSWDEAWSAWDRPGVPQFHQPHNLFPRYRKILQEELPEVLDGLVDNGGTWVNFVANLPPFITDREPRPDDDQLRFVTGRRPMVEFVHALAAENEPRVSIRRGVKVHGFATAPNGDGVVQVVGVETDEGTQRADLVVDAMGRRSPSLDWFAELGGRPTLVESQDSGYTYYTRYFTGELPVAMSAPVSAIGSFMVLTIVGDNSTWSVTLWAPSGDHALKGFRDPEKFERVDPGLPAARALARRSGRLRRAADGRHPRPVPAVRGRRRTRRHRIRGGRRCLGVHQPVGRAGPVHRAHARAAPARRRAHLARRPARVRARVGRGHRSRDGSLVLEPARHRPRPAGGAHRRARRACHRGDVDDPAPTPVRARGRGRHVRRRRVPGDGRDRRLPHAPTGGVRPARPVGQGRRRRARRADGDAGSERATSCSRSSPDYISSGG